MTVFHRSRFDSTTLPKAMASLAEALAGVGLGDRRLLVCVRELADNAIHHSGQGGGWVQAELSDGFTAVTVQDCGVGVHRSMTAMYPDPGVRRAFDDPDRGLGLGLVLQYTRSGAHLLLESGGLALVGSDGDAQVIGKSTQLVQGVVPTLVVPRNPDS